MHHKSISIAEACSQSWQKMTPVKNGRHCRHCSKNVIDFTVMSNAEIIGHLATKNNICGRISQFQLDQLNDSLEDRSKRRFKWNRFVAAAFIISLIAFSKAHAKARAVYITEQVPVNNQDSTSTDTIYKTISGKVIFKRGVKKSMVIIHVKGTKIVDVTDKRSRFVLNVPQNADTLEFKFGGYKNQYVKIDPANKFSYRIKLNAEPDTARTRTVMNDKVTMGEIQTKPGQKFNKELLIRSSREIGEIKF